MTASKLVVFVVAFAAWAAFFYTMDRYIMQMQGLPVGANMMPV